MAPITKLWCIWHTCVGFVDDESSFILENIRGNGSFVVLHGLTNTEMCITPLYLAEILIGLFTICYRRADQGNHR